MKALYIRTMTQRTLDFSASDRCELVSLSSGYKLQINGRACVALIIANLRFLHPQQEEGRGGEGRGELEKEEEM